MSVFGQESHVNESLDFNENLTHLPELLGTSYGHLLRTLNDLCKQGVINKEEEGYRVADRERLNQIGDLY